MSIPKTSEGREIKRFVESPTRPDETAVEVIVGNESSNPVPVDPTTRGNPDTEYNEVNSTGLETLTIIDKTIAIGNGTDLVCAECSGDNVAIFTVEINNVIKYKKRTYFTEYNTSIPLIEKNLLAGDNIKVKVENKRNKAASFNATLQFNEYTV